MRPRPTPLKTEPIDMDSFFDFNQGTTPINAKPDGTPKVVGHDWSNASPFDVRDEQQQHFSGPSHDYSQYKQQVGLPQGSVGSMPAMSNTGSMDGYNSGIDFTVDGAGWSSGIDMDADITMDFSNPPSTSYGQLSGNNDNFVNPNTIGTILEEQPVSHVGRLWPGMHSQQAQQAAMAKAAQAQAVQQRQLKLQAQQAHYRQASQGSAQQSQASQQNVKRPSHVSEPHVEQSITRLLNQMRQGSNVSSNGDDGSGSLSNMARLKKDEDDMDEDERLLASEEGKKLSSKERRQLRNKVSARAFRSRRKEYISQLEGEVAVKAQESNNLRSENAALIAENERYRALIEIVLRHPSFAPFLHDLSKDPTLLGVMGPPQPNQVSQSQHQAPITPTQQNPSPQQQPQQQQPMPQQDSKPDFPDFDISQLQVPQPQPAPHQQQTEQVGMAIIPDNDFSKLDINGFKSIDFTGGGYRSVNAFALTDLPSGPDPTGLLFDSSLYMSKSVQPDYLSTNPIASDLSTLLSKLDDAARVLKTELRDGSSAIM